MTASSLFTSVIEAAMVLHVLGFGLLVLITLDFMKRAVRKDTPITLQPAMPRIALTIPVGGAAPAIEPSLRSLLEQNYSNYHVILVTASKDEPAALLIRRLCAEYAHARHVVAGHSTRCCQKNHNLLAGVATTSSEDSILVFCDSTHVAEPAFLARLTAPIAVGKAKLTSGYRHVTPEDDNLGTLCQMLTVQSIHMLQAIKPITQPWGGATAIDRRIFFENRIPDLWDRTIVDDFTMGPYLQGVGIRSVPVAEACLVTHISGQTLAGWNAWLFRQLQYVKFGMPLTWIAATAVPMIFFCILAYLVMAAMNFLPNVNTPASMPLSLAYIFSLLCIGVFYTRIIPNNAPLSRRLAAYGLLHAAAAWGYMHTWTTNVIFWHGIGYRTSLGGEVIEILRPDTTDTP
eukprot:TRINITY_DN35506_c0_g1_i1.p1 TRINITY_DN35506_c0_g1~~TRINITY_DN35506_c0_g1_i1.p1  ORF type:complete len:402 (-),score=57.26 TRINITY_DN35506_c0_g1_i1:251-1456(-)